MQGTSQVQESLHRQPHEWWPPSAHGTKVATNKIQGQWSPLGATHSPGSKGEILGPRGIWCCVRCSGISGQTTGLAGSTSHLSVLEEHPEVRWDLPGCQNSTRHLPLGIQNVPRSWHGTWVLASPINTTDGSPHRILPVHPQPPQT